VPPPRMTSELQVINGPGCQISHPQASLIV